MRFWLGVLAGFGAAWAALAIWQRMPELGPNDDIDPAQVPGVQGDWRQDAWDKFTRPELTPAPRPYDARRHEGFYP